MDDESGYSAFGVGDRDADPRGIIAAIFSRLVLAVFFGATGVVGVMLIAVAFIGLGDGGSEPGSTADASAVVWRAQPQESPAPATEKNDQGFLEGIRAAAVEELGGHVVDAATQGGLEQVEETRRRLGEMTDSLFGKSRVWWADRTSHVAPATLDLVMAIAVVVGIAGFVIALIRPVFVASIGTAVLGGWMLMACGAVLWSRVSAAGDLPSPFLMLLGWGFATAVGVLVQASTAPAKNRRRRLPPRLEEGPRSPREPGKGHWQRYLVTGPVLNRYRGLTRNPFRGPRSGLLETDRQRSRCYDAPDPRRSRRPDVLKYLGDDPQLVGSLPTSR